MSTRLEQLLEMLKAEPQDAFLRYAVALEYEVAGNLSEAIARIEALINDQPDYLGAYNSNGKSKKRWMYIIVAQQLQSSKTIPRLLGKSILQFSCWKIDQFANE
jgi:tetratricopeptide (TPR) repeat protein